VFRRRKRERVPPDRDAVVDRVLCVSVVAMLGAVVAGVEDGTIDEAKAAEYAAESHRWLRRENLADALTNLERQLIAKPLADWSERDTIDAGWRSESAGVLLWALAVFDDIPPSDTRFESLPARVPLLAPIAGFRADAHLRSHEVIRSARDLDAGEFTLANSIAGQRHIAFDWLCGYATDWGETPVGT
jgi:hypothetical protein